MSTPKTVLTLPAFLARKGIASFFDTNDLCAVAQSSREYRALYLAQHKATDLLFCVLNINTERKKKIQELLAQKDPVIQVAVLTRANGRQIYDHKPGRTWPYTNKPQINKRICMRIFSYVSPLEAAALCGDFHLLRLLLAILSGAQNKETIEQLQETIKQLQEAMEQLKKVKEKLATDPRSFDSLISTLQNAYKEVIESRKQVQALDDHTEFKRLLGVLGDNQKLLSWFLLQVFCNNHYKPNEEPPRECHINTSDPLNLDDIGGSGNNKALHKGRRSNIQMRPYNLPNQKMLEFDSACFENLRAVIKAELDTILKELDQKIMMLQKLEQQNSMLAAYPNPEQQDPEQQDPKQQASSSPKQPGSASSRSI